MGQQSFSQTSQMHTPRQLRTAAFEANLEQEWSEYYFDFMTGNDGWLFCLDPEEFSANPNNSLQTIKNHPEYEWSNVGILENPNLTWDFLKTLGLSGNRDALIMFRMSSKNYKKDYELNADLREIGPPPRPAVNDDITIEEYIDVIDNRTMWTTQNNVNISKNIFPRHLQENPQVNWHYVAYATLNPNMTIDYLRELYDIELNCERSLVYYPITNSVFTYEDIMENPDIPWEYENFGENASLTFDFMLENPTICDGVEYLGNVSVNKFTAEKAAFLERRRREYMAAYKIQQWWLRTTSDPGNVVCQRRLERDFAKFFPDALD